MELVVLFGTFAILLIIGVPVAFCLGLASLATLLYLDIPTVVAFQRMAAGIDVFALMAIPFFIYAGELMNQSGIAEKLVRLAESLLGRLKGGLGHVSVFSCMLFGAVSGSAVAGVSAMGSTLVPMMKKNGYDDDFAVNVTVCSIRFFWLYSLHMQTWLFIETSSQVTFLFQLTVSQSSWISVSLN